VTGQDRGDFATLMLGLGETYGEPVSDARMEIYFAALADLDLAAIRQSATAHVRTSKFFPRPAELREAISGSADERADLAWVQLLREVRRVGPYDRWDSTKGTTVPPSPRFFDEAAERAALEMFGGWGALCTRLPGEGPELLGVAKLFKATYRSYHGRAERAALPPSKDDARMALNAVKQELVKRGLSTGAL
jgi:hypothetical protein